MYAIKRKTAIVYVFLILTATAAMGESPGAEPVYTKTVLGLYNSAHGQTETENEINFYLVNHLRELGLEVEFHDINQGIPSTIDTYRAVISWYRGGTMKRPLDYLAFIRKVIGSGRKFVVFGSLGAYGDSETDEWLSKAVINRSLSLLGLRYEYEWTDDPSLLTIEHIDREMCEYQAEQDVSVSQFYYRFVPSDRNLKVYLSLGRKDRDYRPSPVIATNPNGGFALGSYIYHIKESKLAMLLNIKAFLTASLFPETSGERIGLMVDVTRPPVQKVLDNTEIILNRAKLAYEVIRQDDFQGMLPEDLNRFTSIGLILRNDTGLSSGFFKPFLERGGGVVSLLGGNFNKLSELLSLSGEKNRTAAAAGYRISSDFTFGEELILTNRQTPWSVSPSLPVEDTEILATDFEGNIPLLWSSDRHSSRILVWNWNGFEEKGYRGLLLESFLYIRPVAAAGSPGVAAMFIDDWPIPMYNVKKKPLSITDTEFFTTVWWPDIKSFFDTYDIPFSAYIIFEYNLNNKPPFIIEEFFIGKGQPSSSIAREIIKSEHELAFHGYNHASLLLDDSNPSIGYWPDTESMKKALRTAKDEWIRLFGEHTLPKSYVAPNNSISLQGIDAVHELFPSIHVIGTVLVGKGKETASEFTVDPKRPGLYYLPRVSSGYILDDILRMSISSAIGAYGIWTHFIHADDVFDDNRSRGRSWNELIKAFHESVRFVRRHYPWLDYVTVDQAGRILREYDSMDAEFRWDPGEQTLTVTSVPGFRFRVRQNSVGEMTSIEGGSILHRYRNSSFFIVESTKGECTITF